MAGVETIWDLHTFTITRQMIIIAGGESELCCGMAQRGMLSERVGSYTYTCAKVLSGMQCARVVLCVQK